MNRGLKTMSMLSFYEEKLEQLKKEANFRYLKNFAQEGKFIIWNNVKLLNLSSNDYLGISIDNNIKDNFLSSYKGKLENPSARLLSGSNKPFFELENLIKEVFNKSYKVVAVDIDKWNIIKDNFNSKKQKFEYQDEIYSIEEILSKLNNEPEDDMKSLFGDIVEYN